jgi:hypothetical protein
MTGHGSIHLLDVHYEWFFWIGCLISFVVFIRR